MKKTTFEMRDIFYDMDNRRFEGRRPISKTLKAVENGTLRTVMGDYIEQRRFEEILRDSGVPMINRFFELIPHYTLRENLQRSGGKAQLIEQIADELGLTKLLDISTCRLGALEQEKAAAALAVLKNPEALGFINTCEGLSCGERLCYYGAIDKMCRKYNISGMLFITKYNVCTGKSLKGNVLTSVPEPSSICLTA